MKRTMGIREMESLEEVRATTSRESLKKAGSANNKKSGVVIIWRILKPYAAAGLCVFTAFVIRYWLSPLLGNELPFMMFIAASLLAAWYGGAVTGVVALMLGLVLADHFFVPSEGTGQSVQVFRLVRYLFTASLGIVLIEVLHHGRRKTEAAVRELKAEAGRRETFAKALGEAHDQLRRLTAELEQGVSDRTGELAATVSSLQELLYQMAHHLRAPLRAIDGYLGVIKSDCVPAVNPLAETYFRRVSESVRRMDDLLGDLLQYGMLIHAEFPLAEVRLGEAVKHALVQGEHVIGPRNCAVNVRGPLPIVRGNMRLLHRALAALLDNATKFVPLSRRPVVTIWAEEMRDRTRLWIEDNGIGIDARYHKRVFGAFERLHGSEEYEGNGIGLAMVRLAMQRMRGSCGVQSKPGCGSRFWLEFERCDGPRSAQVPCCGDCAGEDVLCSTAAGNGG